MKTHIFKRGASVMLALLLCLSAFVGIGGPATYAVGEEAQAVMMAFPRNGDANYHGEWGHGDLKFMNGWFAPTARNIVVYTVGSYKGNICYCIEPGTKLETGDRFTQKDETFFDTIPRSYNHTIEPYDIRLLLGRILQYGYTGTVTTAWRSQTDGDIMANAFATQILVWETIVGERDEDFNHVDPGSFDAILDTIGTANPLYSQIMNHYNRIVSSVQRHTKVPSFCERASQKAKTFELTWDGSQYAITLTDNNNVLSEYNFAAEGGSVNLNVSGNKLIVTGKTAPSGVVTIKASKKNATRQKLIVWSDGNYAPGVGDQDTVSYVQSVNDPVVGYVKLKASYGSAKIVKTSEDGKVDGIRFRVTGNGVDTTVTTQNGGQVQISNLAPGDYTVAELAEDKYEPQESRKVTVVSGQTATVTFNNKLKRGALTVTKTAEDGLREGRKFHLFGTSLSGLAVDEYALVDSDGKAYFRDVLIGADYTLEEVDAPLRYVVPQSQTAIIEWNKVTEKSVTNVLKKWNLTVRKSNVETGNAQGDGSLAGAVYGIYDGDELIDRYTTDRNGRFTTKSYPCGEGWNLREISPSEGYLLDAAVYPIGAEAKSYTVEYNSLSESVTEIPIKGKVSIVKHTDDVRP